MQKCKFVSLLRHFLKFYFIIIYYLLILVTRIIEINILQDNLIYSNTSHWSFISCSYHLMVMNDNLLCSRFWKRTHTKNLDKKKSYPYLYVVCQITVISFTPKAIFCVLPKRNARKYTMWERRPLIDTQDFVDIFAL